MSLLVVLVLSAAVIAGLAGLNQYVLNSQRQVSLESERSSLAGLNRIFRTVLANSDTCPSLLTAVGGSVTQPLKIPVVGGTSLQTIQIGQVRSNGAVIAQVGVETAGTKPEKIELQQLSAWGAYSEPGLPATAQVSKFRLNLETTIKSKLGGKKLAIKPGDAIELIVLRDSANGNVLRCSHSWDVAREKFFWREDPLPPAAPRQLLFPNAAPVQLELGASTDYQFCYPVKMEWNGVCGGGSHAYSYKIWNNGTKWVLDSLNQPRCSSIGARCLKYAPGI